MSVFIFSGFGISFSELYTSFLYGKREERKKGRKELKEVETVREQEV